MRPGSLPGRVDLYVQGIIPTPFDAGSALQFIQFGACRLDTRRSVNWHPHARSMAHIQP